MWARDGFGGRRRRLIEARLVCRDGAGGVLVVTGAGGGVSLPGGAVRHGEHPADAAARWAREQAGAPLTVGRPLRVVTDVCRMGGWRAGWLHRDVIVFAGEGDAGPAAGWVAESQLPVVPAAVPTAAPGGGGRRQRFAAYGHVTDPAGNVLLTLIADGYPGAGRWHLPGGGTDFGEDAEAGLHRELAEETAQEGEIVELVLVTHRHAPPAAGARTDFHGVRAVYAVRVPRPSTPRVVEQGGSTAAAAWLSVTEALRLPLTDAARDALARSGAAA